MFKIFYKNYPLPTDHVLIENYLVPRLNNTSVIEFIFDLLTGFKKTELIDIEVIDDFKSFISKHWVMLSSAIVVVGLLIFLTYIFKIIALFLLIYLAIQIVVYLVSILIGFIKFTYFTIRLIWKYDLSVPLIRIGEFSFPYFDKTIVPGEEKDNDSKEERLAFYFNLYKEGAITDDEYQKEKNKILNS